MLIDVRAYFLVAFIVWLSSNCKVFPLDEGSVSGKVVDISGEGVGNAEVVLSADGGDAPVYSAHSGSSGQFLFGGLAFGEYRIHAEAPGFSRDQARRIVVDRSEVHVPDLLLNLGSIELPCPKSLVSPA